MKKKSIKDYEKVDDNPFYKDLVINSEGGFKIRRSVNTRIRNAGDVDDGEHIGLVEVPVGPIITEWVDKQSYTKFFNSEYAFSRLVKCSFSARNLLDYISINLKPNKDVVRLTPTEYLKYVGKKSKEVYYKALVELVELDIIYPYGGALYYINPAVLMNGKRLEFLPDVIEEYEEELVKNYKPGRGIMRRGPVNTDY